MHSCGHQRHSFRACTAQLIAAHCWPPSIAGSVPAGQPGCCFLSPHSCLFQHLHGKVKAPTCASLQKTGFFQIAQSLQGVPVLWHLSVLGNSSSANWHSIVWFCPVTNPFRSGPPGATILLSCYSSFLEDSCTGFCEDICFHFSWVYIRDYF